MTTSIEVAFANHVYDLLKQAQQRPDFNQTRRNIAKRQAGATAKEIGSVVLPTIAGYGVGRGLEKVLKDKTQSAGKIRAMSALPAVGALVGAGYHTANRLRNIDFKRIRKEETDKYEQALKEYEASQKAEDLS